MNASLSYRFFRAATPLMKTGEYKKITQPIFFNTWLGLVHYQILNRDLFSEKFPVMKYKGEDLIKHFINLLKTKQ